MNKNKPLVSVVIGSYNRRSFLKAAIESVRKNGYPFPYEMIVVDGGSTDGTLRYLRKQKDVITIIQHNHGEFRGKKLERRSWGYFMNLGFKAAQGKYILMISDDSLLVPGAIENGVRMFEDLLAEGQKVGGVAFYWRNWPEQKKYKLNAVLNRFIIVNHGLFLRDALEDVGWIDEETFRFYYADGDLAVRLFLAGYPIVGCKTALVEHLNHLKSGVGSYYDDLDHFLEKWQATALPPETHENYKLEYDDPYHTVEDFPTLGLLNIRIRRLWIRLKKIFSAGVKRVKKQNERKSQ